MKDSKKLAVFDLDGTLAQTYRADRACYLRAFEEGLGISNVNTDWRAYPHVTDSSIAREVVRTAWGREPAPGELRRVRDTLLRLLGEQPQEVFEEIPGARSMLKKLMEEPLWGVAVATGGWQATARLKMERCGLLMKGLVLATAEDDTTRERIVEAAIQRAKQSSALPRYQRVVLIGDAPWDVQAARRLSLPFLGVGIKEKAERLKAEGAGKVLMDYKNLPGFLKNLDEAEVPRPPS